jgi:hypothetical protein
MIPEPLNRQSVGAVLTSFGSLWYQPCQLSGSYLTQPRKSMWYPQ